MITRLVCLCACLFPQVFPFSNDQILYQAAQREPYTHVVWVRQTQDSRQGLFQRPVQLLQQQQTQICETPSRQRGRCVRLEECVLADIHQDYVKNKGYFCVLRNQQAVGVCCPDTISSPVRYQEDIFTPTSTRPNTRPNTSRPPTGQQFQQQQQQPTTTTTALPNRIKPGPPGPLTNNMADESYPLADFLICGRNGKKISRITTGAPTTVRDWPWMAALVYRSTFKQFCGGTVITRRHVLTAAHCFPKADPNEVVVLLGDYDLKRPDESKSRAFSVVQMIIHEDFDVTSYENDITILVLNATTVYNSYIQPCCLPSPGPRYTNLTSVVTGWGKMEFGGPSPSVLMEVPIPIWDQQRCVPNFAQTIFDTNLCAGAFEGGKDACQGDSGGPLVIQRRDERWAIVGIVSWGIRCGEKDKPGVYTRVNDYLDWIAQVIL